MTVRELSKPSVLLSHSVSSFHIGDGRPSTRIHLGSSFFFALVDTGAARSVIGRSAWNVLRQEFEYLLAPSISSVTTADGVVQKVLGTIRLPIKCCGRQLYQDFLVVPSICVSVIIGTDLCNALNLTIRFSNDSISINTLGNSALLSGDLSSKQRAIMNDLIEKFRELHSEVAGTTNKLVHDIDTGDAKPFRTRQYPFSPAMMRHLNLELDKMLAAGVVRPSRSPWCSPVLLVKKKSGEYRFCFDGRKLNSVTVQDSYPLPRVDVILDQLRDAKYMTTIDLKTAFWQIPLNSSSIPKTAFAVQGRGLFEFVVLPFGLADSPRQMQRLIDSILGPELSPYVFGYIDDFVIATDSFDKHVEVLGLVLERLREANLTINMEKCQFCRHSLKYLGYIVDREGLKTDPEKVQAVSDFPKPTTVTQVKRFIGLVGWYRRFIPDFSSVSAPITALIMGKIKSNPINWTEEASASFLEIKRRLTNAPLLATPDFGLPFVIQTDASDRGMGAVLYQVIGDVERPIAFASKTLTSAQRNYTVTERECLAVLFGIEKFRPYVEGTKFTVVTDHHSLLWLRNIKDPTGRLCRWAIKLSQHNMEIQHRKGHLNVVADVLSRAPIAVIEIAEPISDRWYSLFLEKIRRSPERYPLFRIEAGKIFKRVENPWYPTATCPVWKLVLPKQDRSRALAECHDNELAAHLGIFKTFHRLSELYFWPSMKQDVIRYVGNCDTCLAHKATNEGRAGLMGEPKMVSFPFQMLSVDLIGPFPRSSSGNQYILIVVDCFSKFSFLKPLTKATARSICRYLENEIFLVYGVPQTLVCDNGTQFTGRLFRQLAEQYNISKIFYNARYHPQNNPAERVNRVVLSAISSYLRDNHRLWDVNLPKINQAIRLARHESTGFSPAFLVFGRFIPTSAKFYGPYRSEDLPKLKDPKKYGLELRRFQECYPEALRCLRRAYVRQAASYNLRKRDVSFEVGTRVWRRNMVLSNAANYFTAKLAPKYVPCEVVKKLGKVTYELRNLHDHQIGRWHVKDIKRDLSHLIDGEKQD